MGYTPFPTLSFRNESFKYYVRFLRWRRGVGSDKGVLHIGIGFEENVLQPDLW